MISTDDLTLYLDREEVAYELIPHRHTETAGEEAAVLGMPPEEIAKTIVLTTEHHGHVRAVIPASERLDLHKVRRVLALPDDFRLATEAELAAAYPGFEVGAVAPFGGPAGDRTVIDRRLANLDTVVLEAGSHNESVRMKTIDVLITSMALVGDICRD
jgi:Ala-tRNA(Pro) deacylase